MKGVQASGEVPEENLDDVVSEPCLELPCSLLKTPQAGKGARGARTAIC